MFLLVSGRHVGAHLDGQIDILLVLALDSKGIINTLKRYYVAMECADIVAFTFAS